MTKEMKRLIWEIIYDLDNSFPDEVLTDEYYEDFFNKYIRPCIGEFFIWKSLTEKGYKG